MKIKEPISNSILDFKEDGSLEFTGKIKAPSFKSTNIEDIENKINYLTQRISKLEIELKELKK